ncbi:MAG: hypothetical protein HS115_06290 [Spirochaetales bacterium]|nr:hypothetical protein [Spirochaetales bacterium]
MKFTYYIVFFVSLSGLQLGAREIDLSIRNGTVQRPARVEKLEVLRLAEGMEIVQTIDRPESSLKLTLKTQEPHLLRATFEGATYNKMIPPPAGEEKEALQATLEVYERGAPLEKIQSTAILQLVKEAGQIRIVKLYALQNDSRQAFDLEEGPEIYLPENAREIRASLKHGAEGMPVPISLEKKGSHQVVRRTLRPGRSELEVEYVVAGDRFLDASPPFQAAHNFVLILWKPADARPRLENAALEELSIPGLGPALRASYGSAPVWIVMDQGGIFLSTLSGMDRNALFPGRWESAVALIAFSAALLLLLSLFALLRK